MGVGSGVRVGIGVGVGVGVGSGLGLGVAVGVDEMSFTSMSLESTIEGKALGSGVGDGVTCGVSEGTTATLDEAAGGRLALCSLCEAEQPIKIKQNSTSRACTENKRENNPFKDRPPFLCLTFFYKALNWADINQFPSNDDAVSGSSNWITGG